MSSRVSLRAVRATLAVALYFAGSNFAFGQSLTAPWAFRDIGAPALPGRASGGPDAFSIESAASYIIGPADQLAFVYQRVSGDMDIRARVDSLTNIHQWAKAGVMIRASLSAGSAQAYAIVSAGGGIAFQRRRAAGGGTAHTSGVTIGAPHWVRLLRQGTVVTAYSSADGRNWTTIGSDTIALGSAAYVGLAVTSQDAGAYATAAISSVQVTRLALPAGEKHADIGSPATKGSAIYLEGSYFVTAGGKDIWDVKDEFHYVYRPVTGDVEIIARVASLSNTDPWTKGGVMIRESLTAGSRHAVALTTPSRGYAFQRRVETAGLSTNTSGGAGTAPGWLRLVRSGSVFQAYRSNDGASWTLMGSDSIVMGETVYAGLALTSRSVSAAASAVFDSVRVTETAPTVNQPPSVTLSGPPDGSTFAAPAAIVLTADAADPEGRLDRVQFYMNGNLAGTDSAAPFSAAVSGVAAGTYTLTAVAFDADGGTATSASVDIVVAAPPPPTGIVFQPSSDHTTNVTFYLFEVFANGANPATATPLASSNLGKPQPAGNGDVTAYRAPLFSALASGNYVATVSAIGPGGRARSAPVTFTR